MIKGCQKRMIHVKNTGCDLFDEAYFVLKKDVLPSDEFEDNFIQTATAIINQNNLKKSTKKRKKSSNKLLFFILGFVSSAIPCSILLFLF